MKEFTISLEDEQYQKLVKEAERRGVSKSEVAHEIFAQWYSSSRDSHNERATGEEGMNNSSGTNEKDNEEILKRLNELEERVDDLEAGEVTSSGPDLSGVSTAGPDEEAESDDGGEPDHGMANATTSTGRGARTREEAEQQPDPEPPDDDLRERAVRAFEQTGIDVDTEYADALAAVLEYAREHGSVSMCEAVENVMLAGRAADYDMEPAQEYVDPDCDRNQFHGAWWRNMTEALKVLPEIEEPAQGASAWRWVGQKESDT